MLLGSALENNACHPQKVAWPEVRVRPASMWEHAKCFHPVCICTDCTCSGMTARIYSRLPEYRDKVLPLRSHQNACLLMSVGRFPT